LPIRISIYYNYLKLTTNIDSNPYKRRATRFLHNFLVEASRLKKYDSLTPIHTTRAIGIEAASCPHLWGAIQRIAQPDLLTLVIGISGDQDRPKSLKKIIINQKMHKIRGVIS
jgi:hypothetical protein